MPVGLFDSFDNLDQINIADIARWLKPVPNEIQLENYLANRVLYPQIVPTTALDMKIDLAILREALKINGPKLSQNQNSLLGDNPFLNITLRKVLIPERFISFVPDLVSLTWGFVDAFLIDRQRKDYFEDLWTVTLINQSDEIIGSIILPQFKDKQGSMDLKLEGKTYQIKSGSLTVIPCLKGRCEISYILTGGKILGKNEAALEISGGRLGLMIDGRST